MKEQKPGIKSIMSITYAIVLMMILLTGLMPVYAASERVVFIQPKVDEIWSGDQKIKIRLIDIDPADVRKVEFYLDGRLMKEFETPPYAFTHFFGAHGSNRVLKVVVRGEQSKILGTAALDSFQVDDRQEVEVNRILVPVVVLDKDGNYVRGLKKEDFQVMVDGKPRKITNIAPGGVEKFNMVQVIDISYSMRYKIHDVLKASRDFLRQLLTENDKGTFVFFNHIVYDHMGLTNDIDELMERTKLEAPPAGNTALNDAVASAINMVNKYPGWNIIVVFSDGDDNSSYTDPYSLLEKIKKSSAVVYAIDNNEVSFQKKGVRKTVLEMMCETSGGMTFPLDSVKKTNKVFKKIREDIKSQYILYFNATGRRKTRFHEISVTTNNKEYRTRTIKGYY